MIMGCSINSSAVISIGWRSMWSLHLLWIPSTQSTGVTFGPQLECHSVDIVLIIVGHGPP